MESETQTVSMKRLTLRSTCLEISQAEQGVTLMISRVSERVNLNENINQAERPATSRLRLM